MLVCLYIYIGINAVFLLTPGLKTFSKATFMFAKISRTGSPQGTKHIKRRLTLKKM